MTSLTPSMGIQLKLFLGVQVRPDLRLLLDHSNVWQHARICNTPHSDELSELTFQGKEYIGKLADTDKIALSYVESMEQIVIQHLKVYCPNFGISRRDLVLFTQTFIA